MKFVKIICAAMLAMCLFAIQAFAAQRIPVYKIGDTIYFFDKETGTVNGFAGEPVNVTIPAQIGGYNVYIIGKNAFANAQSLQALTISEGIISIASGAFMDCKSLESVNIPSTISYIADNAFYDCTSLKTVNFVTEFENIGVNAFYNTPWLGGQGNEFTIIGNTSLVKYNGNEKKVVVPDGVKTINANAFAYNNIVEEVVLPEGLTEIGESAFVHCYNLKTVNIPETVMKVGAGAFDDTIWLHNQTADFVSINGILTAYKGNDKNVTIPDGITGIGGGAFMANESICSVTVPSSVLYIDSMAFCGCTNLVWAYIPDSVEWIDEFAFEQCDKLTLLGNQNAYLKYYADTEEIDYNTYIRVCVNGQNIDFSDCVPEIYYDRTFVPLRAIMEKCGYVVKWNDEDRSIVCSKNGNDIKITDSGYVASNEKVISTDAKPIYKNGCTLMSVRVVCDAMEMSVAWNDAEKTVLITD